MKPRIITVYLTPLVAVALYAGQENASPEKEGITAQAITYCCGNHPKTPHCGYEDDLAALEKAHGCTDWRARRPKS
jgi:hypothetical protein